MRKGGFIYLLIFVFTLSCSKGIGSNSATPDGKLTSVNEIPSILYFQAEPKVGKTPLKVRFTWDIRGKNLSEYVCVVDADGDGKAEYKKGCNEGKEFIYVYEREGIFKAVLKILRNSREITSSTAEVEAVKGLSVLPEINIFEAQPVKGETPLKVTFRMDVSGIEVCKLDVDGDGNEDFVFEPCKNVSKEYVYDIAGSYTPTLTAGDGIQKSLNIKVLPEFWSKRIGTFWEDFGALIAKSHGEKGFFISSFWGRRIFIFFLNKYGELMWFRAFVAPSGNLYPLKLIPTPEGGALIFALHDSSIFTSVRYLLLRLDSEGNILRSVYLKGMVNIKSVYLNKEGNIFIIGSKTISQSPQNIGIVKLDKDGNIVWAKRYRRQEYKHMEGIDIIETSDGNLIVLGASENDIVVLKVNKESGELIKAVIIKGDSYDIPKDILTLKSGGIIITASTSSFGSNGYYNCAVVKLDSDLNVLWQKVFSLNKDILSIDTERSEDNSLLLVLTDNRVLAKLEGEAGNILWAKSIQSLVTIEHFRDDRFLLLTRKYFKDSDYDFVLHVIDNQGNGGSCNVFEDVYFDEYVSNFSISTLNLKTDNMDFGMSDVKLNENFLSAVEEYQCL